VARHSDVERRVTAQAVKLLEVADQQYEDSQRLQESRERKM